MRATLSTLYAYLSWVPLAYVFESNLVEALLKLFPQPPYRNVALQCLSEARKRCSSDCAICCVIYVPFVYRDLPLLMVLPDTTAEL